MPTRTLPDATVLTELTPPPRTGRRAVSLTFPANTDAVRDVLHELDQALASHQLDEDARGSTEIVLAELLNNVVEHAYGDTSRGQIALSVDIIGKELVATVADRGRPLPNHQIPAKHAADLDVAREDLPEGGYGWFLIHELVEDLQYSRVDTLNLTRFTIRLNSAG